MGELKHTDTFSSSGYIGWNELPSSLIPTECWGEMGERADIHPTRLCRREGMWMGTSRGIGLLASGKETQGATQGEAESIQTSAPARQHLSLRTLYIDCLEG